jgi:hypothetical protein
MSDQHKMFHLIVNGLVRNYLEQILKRARTLDSKLRCRLQFSQRIAPIIDC